MRAHCRSMSNCFRSIPILFAFFVAPACNAAGEFPGEEWAMASPTQMRQSAGDRTAKGKSFNALLKLILASRTQ
jgi:hypothetical protein